MGCASREGRADCLRHGGKGTGGRREHLMEPQYVSLRSCGCNVTCTCSSSGKSSLKLKVAQVYWQKALPDCYPDMANGCFILGVIISSLESQFYQYSEIPCVYKEPQLCLCVSAFGCKSVSHLVILFCFPAHTWLSLTTPFY